MRRALLERQYILERARVRNPPTLVAVSAARDMIAAMRNRIALLATPCACLVALAGAQAQTTGPSTFAAEAQVGYRAIPNITYLTANNYEAKLDLYQARGQAVPQPTVLYIHGGGWTAGSKESSILTLLPYFEMGFNVVNVEYRLARVSLAPAAVEDCLCALRWVIHNAKEYNIDTSRIVVTGNSAGGHLALTTGMIPPSAGLDRQCPGPEELKVAAIVNWYGITDVADLLDGPNMKVYAVTWLGSRENRKEIAGRVSPLTYVRPGLPPILSIQGDADPTVPYSHSVRLHAALEKAGVPNKLITVPGGLHGNFKPEEYPHLYAEIRDFLAKHNLVKHGS
jgi:acetyl esterase/lipase